MKNKMKIKKFMGQKLKLNQRAVDTNYLLRKKFI